MSSQNGGRYYVNQSVFLCPDVPTNDGNYSPEWDYFPNSGCGNIAGGMPRCSGKPSLMALNSGSTGPTNEDGELSIATSKIVRPANIMIFTEMWNNYGGFCLSKYGQCPMMMATTWFYPVGSTGQLTFHSGGGNNLYVDGHVKWVSEINNLADYDDMWAENSL